MAALIASNAEEVGYVDKDGSSKTETATKITETATTLNTGWYYVDGTVTIPGKTAELKISGGQNVKIILRDGCDLILNRISEIAAAELTIYGQSAGSGKLTVNKDYDNGEAGLRVSTITINGGAVTAKGGSYGAGIGGDFENHGSTVTINGGVVYATGKPGTLGSGSGIGGGSYGDGGLVTINGGTVVAQGGEYASGIGGGYDGNGGTVVIKGGSVKSSHGEDTFNGADDIGTGDDESITDGRTLDPGSLTDGANNNVYLNTITVGVPAAAGASVTEAIIGGITSFGVNDLVTDEDGKVYFYLPPSANEQEVILTVGGKAFRGKYKREANHDNAETLLPPCADRIPDGRQLPEESCGMWCIYDTNTGKCAEPVLPDEPASSNPDEGGGLIVVIVVVVVVVSVITIAAIAVVVTVIVLRKRRMVGRDGDGGDHEASLGAGAGEEMSGGAEIHTLPSADAPATTADLEVSSE